MGGVMRLLPFLSLLPTVFAAGAPMVDTAAGSILGLTDGTVNKFLGIPFALSPPLRFSAPVDPKPWTSPLNATQVKAACIQQINEPVAAQAFINRIFNNPPPPESEDCLYLNVWAPSKAAPEGGFPVFFWIYGGDLQFGTGSLPVYDGTNLAAARDVVVVTHNYRTNVFGFPNSPELPKGEGNPGFLDQRKALDWVNKNIAKFGGNPAKVTLAGQSAGGYSVRALVANPPSPLNFRAAIIMSEASSPKNGPESWDRVTKAVGCSSGAGQLDCMRKVDALTLKQTIQHLILGFAPVDDGVTASTNVESNFKSGKAAKVPVIIGSDAEDGSPFSLSFAFTNTTDPKAKLSPPNKATTNSINLLEFQCPAALLADLMVENSWPGVWRYYFNASFPQFEPFPEAGAFHGIEIEPLFGNYRLGQADAWTDASSIIQGGFMGFVADPESGPGWEKQTNDSKPIGLIVNNGLLQRSAEAFDADCSSYSAVIAAQGL